MTRKSIASIVIALMAIGLLGYSLPATAQDSPDVTLLVVPSHYTTVQIAFDVAKLRKNIMMVSFSEVGVKTGQALYIWDAAASAWVKTTFADYGSGSIFAVKPGKVILIGTERDIPPVLGEVSAWCSNVKRVPTLGIMEVFNGLHEYFDFSTAEWRWIAKTYELKLEDKNAERRRYGKYGKPGERVKAPMPVSSAPESAEAPKQAPTAPVTTIQTEAPETNTQKSKPENK